jgi:hypothetical protein
MNQYMQLRQELVKYWAPPPGVADDLCCQLTAHVDRCGQLQDIVITQSSGVLMFDIIARGALLAVVWPSWTYGTSIDITFKS